MFRMIFTANPQTIAPFVLSLTGGSEVPLGKDTLPYGGQTAGTAGAVLTPGAISKIIVDLSHDKTTDATPAVHAIKPGYENSST